MTDCRNQKSDPCNNNNNNNKIRDNIGDSQNIVEDKNKL